MIKKVLCLVPMLSLFAFMYWMNSNYYSAITVILQEGESFSVSIDGKEEVIDETKTFKVWSGDHRVIVSGDNHVSDTFDVSVAYRGSSEIDPDLELKKGLRQVDVPLPFDVYSKGVLKEYRGNLEEVSMANDDLVEGAKSDLKAFPKNAFKAEFTGDFSKGVISSGNIIDERVDIYYTDSGKKIRVDGDVVSYSWSKDGKSLSILKRTNVSPVVSLGGEKSGIVKQGGRGLELFVWSEESGFKSLGDLPGMEAAKVKFSPDGERIVLHALGTMPDRDLYVVNLFDSKLKKITEGGFVYGFEFFEDGSKMLIDKVQSGTSLRSLIVKNLVSGSEERIGESVDLGKVTHFKDNFFVIAEKGVHMDVEYDGFTDKGLVEGAKNIVDNFGVSEDEIEKYYLFDYKTKKRNLIYDNSDVEMDVKDIIFSKKRSGLYLVNENGVKYFLTTEL